MIYFYYYRTELLFILTFGGMISWWEYLLYQNKKIGIRSEISSTVSPTDVDIF